MAQRYDNMKNMTFLSRKLEELVIIKAVQSFSAKMLPFFNPESYPFHNEFYSSIMASDSSPTGEYKEFSYAAPGRSTPPPTTSYLSARQESQAIAVDPNVTKPTPDKEQAEDLKEKEHKDKDKDDVDMSAPDANPGYKPDDRKEEKRDQKDDKGGGGDAKLNGVGKLETHFMLPLDAKDSDEEESESCTVNCLYYTMQCCECVIT